MASFRERLRAEVGNVPRGFLMGAADIIPGISGGTIALVLGIYERFITALRSLNVQAPLAGLRFLVAGRKAAHREAFKKHFARMDLAFLVMLGTGIAGALVTMSYVIKWVLHHHPVPLRGFLFGLILASAAIPLRRMKAPRTVDYLLLPVGIAIAFLVATPGAVKTPTALWFTFVSGAVAICAMMLPGVSGSLLLVLLGKWVHMLDAIRTRQIVTIVVFGAGCFAGLIGFSRVLHWLLRRYHDATMAFLTGLMLGALRAVWPWQVPVEVGLGPNVMPTTWGGETPIPMATFVAGVGVVVLLQRLEKQRQSPSAPNRTEARRSD